MATASPSWSDTEDQPWKSDVDFGYEDVQSPAAAPNQPQSLEQKPVPHHPNKTIQAAEQGSEMRTALAAENHAGLADASAEHGSDLTTLAPVRERSSVQHNSQKTVRKRDHTTDNRALRVTNGIAPLQVPDLAPNPSIADSSVLDSSVEKVHETSKQNKLAIPEESTSTETGPIYGQKETMAWSHIDTEVEQTELSQPLDAAEESVQATENESVDEPAVAFKEEEEAPIELPGPETVNSQEAEAPTGSHETDQSRSESHRDKQNAALDYRAEYASHTKADLIAKIEALAATLEETEDERNRTKSQLEGILSKVSSMKAVFQNYKETQEELEVVKTSLSEAYEDLSVSNARTIELERDVEKLSKENAHLQEQNIKLVAKNQQLDDKFALLSTESSDLNNECDRLSQQLTTMQREYQTRDDTFEDEKYTLENEVSKLSKRLSEQKAAFNELEVAKEELTMAKKNLELVVEELRETLEQKDATIAEIQSQISAANKVSHLHLNEMKLTIVRNEEQIAALQDQVAMLKNDNKDLLQQKQQVESDVERYKAENERIGALEEEVHSKQVIIGKLRQEGIILHEHLTKSVTMLRQKLSDGDSTVDKELVSNMFINFLQFPRGDTKKFEALQLIAEFLSWDDLRKIQAGLTNRGASDKGENQPPRVSFISLWTDFLDKESSRK